MLAWIFYIWGVINVLQLIVPIFYDKKFLKNRLTHKASFQKKSLFVLSANYSTFVWCLIGLFSSQWLWFIFYFFYIFITRKLIKVDLLNKPSRINIELNRLLKISILLIILFPIANHFFLDINILNYFIDLLKQCMNLFRI